MRLAFYTVLVLLAALLDRSLLTTWWWMPDLALALAAWAMVDGTEDGVVWRAWIAGLACDLADPLGNGFHLLAYTGLGIALLPLRRFLFRTRYAAWMVWAAFAFLVLRLGDGMLGGFGGFTAQRLVLGAATTALAAAACGWLFGGVAQRWRPVGAGGA